MGPSLRTHGRSAGWVFPPRIGPRAIFHYGPIRVRSFLIQQRRGFSGLGRRSIHLNGGCGGCGGFDASFWTSRAQGRANGIPQFATVGGEEKTLGGRFFFFFFFFIFAPMNTEKFGSVLSRRRSPLARDRMRGRSFAAVAERGAWGFKIERGTWLDE